MIFFISSYQRLFDFFAIFTFNNYNIIEFTIQSLKVDN